MTTKKFLVSTDISGIFGTPKDWDQIWGSVLKSTNFCGFEMIGWRWGNSFIGPHSKHRIVGIHGRTAGWSEGREIVGKFTLSSLNNLFLSFTQLIKAGERTEYILLHRGTLNDYVLKTLTKNKDNIKLLLIENDLVPNSTDKTIQKIKYLNENGVNTGLMFDLVHFLREPHLDAPNIKRWDLLLKILNDLKKVDFPINCHFPIGKYANDSLPVFSFTEEMWTELSRAMNKVPFKYIVLENQAPRKYSLLLNKKDKLYFRARTEEVFLKLKKYKII